MSTAVGVAASPAPREVERSAEVERKKICKALRSPTRGAIGHATTSDDPDGARAPSCGGSPRRGCERS
jgi:hypothetical protein